MFGKPSFVDVVGCSERVVGCDEFVQEVSAALLRVDGGCEKRVEESGFRYGDLLVARRRARRLCVLRIMIVRFGRRVDAVNENGCGLLAF